MKESDIFFSFTIYRADINSREEEHFVTYLDLEVDFLEGGC